MILYFFSSLTVTDSYSFNLGATQPMLGPLTYYLSSHGITFLIILVNSIGVYAIINKSKKAALALVLLFLALSGFFIYSNFSEIDPGRKIKVALIQGDFQEDWQTRIAMTDNEIISKYTELTRQAIPEKPDLIVWPEHALPKDIFSEAEIYNSVSTLAREAQAYLIIGTVLDGELTSVGDRALFYDSALVFSPDGEMIGRYDAAEPFPFKNDKKPGLKIVAIETDIGKIGITICYDEFFEYIYREYQKQDVDFFVTLSNDAPIKNNAMLKVRSFFSRLRAAETRKYVFRVGNTGVTQVVNPWGRVVDRIDINQANVLVSEISL